MSDRRADDDTQPIAPRRTLNAPAGASSAGSATQARTQDVPPVRTQDMAPPARTQDMAPSARTQDVPPARTHDVPAARTGVSTGAATVAPPAAAPSAPSSTTPRVTAAPTDRTPPRARSTVRKARLRVARVDPWSVMKMAFALSIALAVVVVVAVVVVWLVLDAAGVWEAINSSVSTVLDNDSGFDVTNYVGLSRVVGVTLVVAVVDVLLLTALATLAAFLYNLAASLLGGLEVTLAEDR